ncbi:amidohydrolase [candidate division KSB1 bacterium]|nr:amidohydrolase [candidate division KSB1 bacterium]
MKVTPLAPHISKLADTLAPALIKIRHHLHQYPEPGRQEKETTAYLIHQLEPFNLQLTTHYVETGFWADLQIQPDAPFLALRCDIDALPIAEKNEIPYASKNEGVMHACGHDAHAAVLSGAAMVLSRLKSELTGNVRFIFQPAEEITPGGALDMIERGVLEGVEAILTLHSDPRIEVGKVGFKFGPFMASTDIFKIQIFGKGAHAANPHKSIDPIMIAAQLINSLHQVISREINPVTPAVITVTRILAGTTINVIPGEAEIWGTLRALDKSTRTFLQNRLREVTASLCEMHHAQSELTLDKGAPPVVNDDALCQIVRNATAEILGESHVKILVEPDMGAEDFAWYLQTVPGMIFRLGTKGRPGSEFELHHPNFDIDDRALAVGVKVFCMSVFKYFEGKEEPQSK